MKKVAVTGATGFLGLELCLMLKERGYDVFPTGRNLSKAKMLIDKGLKFTQASLENSTELRKAFLGVDSVVHCAALSSLWGSYDQFYRANVLGTQNVVNVCKELGIKEIIHISTPTLYIEKIDKLNVKESDPLPDEFINSYAHTKFLAEKVIEKNKEMFKKIVIIRPQAIYGEGDVAIRPRIEKLMKKGILPIIGDGKSLIDITHVKNVCHSIELSLSNESIGQWNIFNITDGQVITNTDLLKRVYSELGVNYREKKLSFRFVFALGYCLEKISILLKLKKEPLLMRYSACALGLSRTLDISKAEKKIGYRALIDQEAGLNSYIKWWKETS